MRNINQVIIHCSATKAGQDFRAADIDRWHRAKGWQCIGYHYVVDLDGTVEVGRPLAQMGAHCTGHNAYSIGICYIGGLDANGKAADTRTDAQRKSLRALVELITGLRSNITVHGHREFANKACPCFDVSKDL